MGASRRCSRRRRATGISASRWRASWRGARRMVVEGVAPAERAGALETLREQLREVGIPRLVIGVFLLALFGIAVATHMDLRGLIPASLLRVARNGLLVLALLPAIQGGLGLNFGLPVGIVCGLVACVITLNAGMAGWPALGLTALIGAALAVPAGVAYGWLLQCPRGPEMIVGTLPPLPGGSGGGTFWDHGPVPDPPPVLG